MYTSFPDIHTKVVCALENGPVFLMAKYKIVTLGSKNKKEKENFYQKLKKNEVR